MSTQREKAAEDRINNNYPSTGSGGACEDEYVIIPHTKVPSDMTREERIWLEQQHMQEAEELFDNEGLDNGAEKDDDILEDDRVRISYSYELKAHLEKIGRDGALEKAKKYTVIPTAVLDAIECICKDAGDGYKELDIICQRSLIFRFEILESYLDKNDFPTKEEWDRRIEEEYEGMVREKILPELFMSHFKGAAYEIRHEFTMANIKEIKDILSG